MTYLFHIFSFQLISLSVSLYGPALAFEAGKYIYFNNTLGCIQSISGSIKSLTEIDKTFFFFFF